MIWQGYRPSDDPCTYGYNIPGNMFAAGALEKLLYLNARVWKR
jgi:meiotically up-regulated gene 157 (Mug157) protein